MVQELLVIAGEDAQIKESQDERTLSWKMRAGEMLVCNYCCILGDEVGKGKNKLASECMV